MDDLEKLQGTSSTLHPASYELRHIDTTYDPLFPLQVFGTMERQGFH